MKEGMDDRILRIYLSRYRRSRERKKELEDRIASLRKELGAEEKTTSVKFQVEEISERIEKEKKEMARNVTEIMDLVSYTPADSIERSILEMRHIDCMEWTEIARHVHMTRTPCNKYYKKGLQEILGNKRARKILHDYWKRA